MTDAQLELARWLAGSDVWRGWATRTDGEAPVVAVKSDGSLSMRFVALARSLDGYLPDITSPLMVGPLVEMLRAAAQAKGHAHPPSLYCEDGPESWSACLYPHQEGNSVFTRSHMPDGTTDAEALCALLKDVTG